MTERTHADLCHLAAKWLKRSQGQKGPGCQISFTETPSGWSGEIPDAIGFRSAGFKDGSVVVEVKMSRSDFLADSKKPHRNGTTIGIGKWRYYLCPEGLIKPEELPEKWGLLYLTKRGGVKPIVGAPAETHYGKQQSLLEAMAFERDMEREQFILVKLLSRLSDPDKVNLRIREAEGRASRLAKTVDDLRKEINTSGAKLGRRQSTRRLQTAN